MTLNNWLCRNFDTEKKGYVTAGEIVFVGGGALLIMVIVAFIIATAIYSVYRFFIMGGFSAINEMNVPSYQAFGGVVVVLILFGIVLFILALIIIFLEFLLNVKIAKCERKEGEK